MQDLLLEKQYKMPYLMVEHVDNSSKMVSNLPLQSSKKSSLSDQNSNE